MPPLETPGHSQAILAQSFVRTLLLYPGSWCTQGFLCALQESVSLVLWKFCNQIPVVFKVKFPGGSQFFCQIPRLGNLLWALELLQQCENFFGIIVLQLVVCRPGGSVVGLTQQTSQICRSRSPCLRGRPLLTCASTGDRQVWLSLLWGPWVLVPTRFCLSPLSVSGKYGVCF